jgi:23S rRNA (guanosine2251-2'-O)-methyltransferase
MKKFKKFDARTRGEQPRKAEIPAGRCVVGIHAVRELLRVRPRSITRFSLREKYSDHPELKELAEQAQSAGVKVRTEPLGALDKLANAHQGVIAFSSESPEADWPSIYKAECSIVVALDEVEDPHNLGAVLRTAWLMGAAAVLTPERRSAQLSPAVSKVAQGGCEHVPLESGSLPQLLEDLKKDGFWIIGMSHTAKQTIFQLKVPEKVVWVLGSESGGLRKPVENVCDDFVSIPQVAVEASYNVSVSAAIALSETYRQLSAKR